MTDFNKKNVIITGGSGGIGKELVSFFADCGAVIFLPLRNIKKGEALKKEVLKKSPNAKITLFETDLSSFDSIEKFCNSVNFPVDLIINVAGVYHLPKKKSFDGFSLEFAVNFAAPLFLSLKLLPKMSENGKTVAVSSIAADWFSAKKNDFQGFKRTKTASYGSSKFLLNCAFCYLSKKEEHPFVLCQPGVSATSLFSAEKGGFNSLFEKIIVPVMKVVFPSPKKASKAVIEACFKENPPKNSICGAVGLFHVWGKPEFYPLKKKFLNAEILTSATKEIKEKTGKKEFNIFEN